MEVTHVICCSLNIRGLNKPLKRRCLLIWSKCLHLDILFLQETYLLAEDTRTLKGSHFVTVYSTNFSSCSRGVAIFIGRDAQLQVASIELDPQRSYIFLIGSLGSKPFLLLNSYAPNGDSRLFFKDLYFKIIPHLAKFGRDILISLLIPKVIDYHILNISLCIFKEYSQKRSVTYH